MRAERTSPARVRVAPPHHWFSSLLFGLLTLGVVQGCAGPESDADGAGPERGEAAMMAAFSSDRGGELDLYLLTPGTDDVQPLVTAPGSQYGPSWSPDGQHVLYDTQMQETTDVWRVSADGSETEQLTDRPGYDGNASYSPDGQRIVFVSDRDAMADGHRGRDLWIMNPDGTEPTRLTRNDMYEGAPRYSPDGQRIAFCRQLRMDDGSEDGEIFVMDADGSNERRLTDTPGFDCLPDWSPDGALLAFHRCQDAGCWIYALAADGQGEAVRVSPDSLPGQWPRWSPNGGWIAYTSSREQQTEIVAVRPDGSGAHAMTAHPARDEVLAWQPRR